MNTIVAQKIQVCDAHIFSKKSDLSDLQFLNENSKQLVKNTHCTKLLATLKTKKNISITDKAINSKDYQVGDGSFQFYIAPPRSDLNINNRKKIQASNNSTY